MSSTEAATTKHSFCGVPTVTILVGENSRSFLIHRDQLCETSSFFKAAFEGAFLEGRELRMSLPEEDEHTFDLFIKWLYNQGYEISAEKEQDQAPEFMEPVKLYVLADKYDVTDLKSHIITKLFALRQEKRVPGMATVAYAYEHTLRNSRLRKFLVDWWACKVRLPWFRLEFTQKWLERHPEVASAVISSFANTMSRKTQKDLFGADAVEEYEEDQQESE